jgi:hypothetical protein
MANEVLVSCTTDVMNDQRFKQDWPLRGDRERAQSVFSVLNVLPHVGLRRRADLAADTRRAVGSRSSDTPEHLRDQCGSRRPLASDQVVESLAILHR